MTDRNTPTYAKPTSHPREEDPSRAPHALPDPEHPDRVGLRGNPQTDDGEVDRGRDKLDRVLGW